jgi:hypothetical protein
MSTKKTTAQTPEKLTGIRLTKIPKAAVGFKAIRSTFAQINREVGLVKGMGLLAKINQKDGFDCPGCAWPDPDEKRAFLAEYCENGAKLSRKKPLKIGCLPCFLLPMQQTNSQPCQTLNSEKRVESLTPFY